MEENKSVASEKQIPTPIDIFNKVGLYEIFYFKSNSIDAKKIMRIEFFSGTIDLYCPYCKSISTFQSRNKSFDIPFQDLHPNKIIGITKDRIFDVTINCARIDNHEAHFIFLIQSHSIQKIGQFPSISDLNSQNIVRYKKVLGNEKYLEYSKAIGLYSHGIGIGSFVYLRRIFEFFIEEAHLKAKKTKDWKDIEFNQKRIEDKIVALKSYLPIFLSDNYHIYSILSKGIHALNEQECLEYFIVLKNSIELILEENLSQIEKDKKIVDTKKSLAMIHSLIKKK